MSNFLNIAIQDKRKARVYTAILMLLFFLVLIFAPLFSYQNPPPGMQGLLVSFGDVDAGQGSESPDESAKPIAEAKPTKKENKPVEKKPSKSKPKAEEKPEAVKTPIDEKVISARNEEIALQKKKAKDKKVRDDKRKKEKEESQAKADAIAKAESEKIEKERAEIAKAEQKRKAEENAKAIAAAESAAKAKATSDFKNSLAESLKKGNGGGQGDGGRPGDQGVNNGDPSAEALKGLSTGTGKIGGGISDRGGRGPGISDSSNKTGTVVIFVCIDGNGQVTSADFKLKGSTTSDADLRKLAIDNAKKWSFNTGIADSTCGTITYDFKVK